MCLCVSDRPTATAIFHNEARNDEAASLLDSAAGAVGHSDNYPNVRSA